MFKKTDEAKKRIHLPLDYLTKATSGRRIVLLVLAVLIAGTAFTYGIFSLLNDDSSWREIEATSVETATNKKEFSFSYIIEGNSMEAGAFQKQLAQVYSKYLDEAFILFHESSEFEDWKNLASINQNPNQEVDVPDRLYKVLEHITQLKYRNIFLAPIYVQYENLLFSSTPTERELYDPALNQETAEFYRQIKKFAQEEQAVSLELLGNHKVKLHVSEAYLTYAKDHDIPEFMNMFWLKNACIIDYVADSLIADGYTNGSISSYDGFVRNLDKSETSYSFNLFDRVENQIMTVGRMDYQGPLSMVYMRDYPRNDLDVFHYYEREDGEIYTPYLGWGETMGKAALSDLVSYSKEKSCLEIALQIFPVFTSAEFSGSHLQELTEQSIYSIYSDKDSILHCNNPETTIKIIQSENHPDYKIEYEP